MRVLKRSMMGSGSRYVKYDPISSTYELRAPSAVVRWPQLLRERIITHFISAKTGLPYSLYKEYKILMEQGSWNVHGSRVYFSVRYLTKDRGRKAPLTFLLSDRHKTALLFDSTNPTMRSLVAYSFVTNTEIVGLPKLRLIDKQLLMGIDDNGKPV